MEEAKLQRNLEEQRNKELGTPGDIDFQRMIRVYRENAPPEQNHLPPGEMKICIAVRKRPISAKEIKKNDYDSITCSNPVVVCVLSSLPRYWANKCHLFAEIMCFCLRLESLPLSSMHII